MDVYPSKAMVVIYHQYQVQILLHKHQFKYGEGMRILGAMHTSSANNIVITCIHYGNNCQC